MDATPPKPPQILALARSVLVTEAAAITSLIDRLGTPFVAAVELMLACRGRVVVSGMGKSGHVARKLASTLASTGTPAFFVHPADASHGDLGMITPHDVFIAISNSGESDELMTILPSVKRQGAKVIALTGNQNSSLAVAADVHLDAHVDSEACPLGLAPTASTTAALALGDALALALLDARGFSADDFARSHPGGALGRRLLTTVRDVMRVGADVPSVAVEASVAEAIVEMSRKAMGMTAIVQSNAHVVGIFTDGDLRRCLSKLTDFHRARVAEFMTTNPRSIGPDQLAVEAVALIERHKSFLQLLVVDPENKLVGALHMHDLLRAKVV